MSQPTKLSLSQIEYILARGDFDGLMGTIEHGSLECKREIYVMREALGKVELAKDVSALANSSGRYILVGVHTEESQFHQAM